MKKFFVLMAIFAIAFFAFPLAAESSPAVSSGVGGTTIADTAATVSPVISVQAKSVVLSPSIVSKIVTMAIVTSSIDWAILSVIALILYLILKAIATKSSEKPKEEGSVPWWKRLFGWIRWGMRQMLPLTYRSHYADGDGKKHFAVWRMWLGKCFDQEDVIVAV